MAIYLNGELLSSLIFNGEAMCSGGTNPLTGTPVLHSQIFNASGSFIVPANVYQLFVICTGGGSSARYDDVSEYYIGGYGSTRIKSFIHVNPLQNILVTIGAGGASGNGGQTSFGSFISCPGGPSGEIDIAYSNPNGIKIYKDPGISPYTTTVTFAGGYQAPAMMRGEGWPGGFGNPAASYGAGPANSGAGGGWYGGNLYSGGSGKCVIYWFTYT